MGVTHPDEQQEVAAETSIAGPTASSWQYFAVLVAGALSFVALAWDASSPPSWQTLILLTLAAIATEMAFAADDRGHRPRLSAPFLFAGVILLPPPALAILVITLRLAIWLRSSSGWRVLAYDGSVNLSGVAAAYFFHNLVVGSGGHVAEGPTGLLAAVGSAGMFILVSSLVTAFARDPRLRMPSPRRVTIDSALTQFVVMLLGLPVAVFWQVNAWLIVAALAPMILIHRALNVPLLEKEARTDTKTGLHNMRAFNEALSRELQRASRFGHPVSVLMVDLDLLRHVNNSYGHQVGDLLLSGIAEAIQSQIREYDVAARFGGDEFIVLLVECDSDNALQVAERMRRLVEGLSFAVPTSLGNIGATVSIGAASFPRHGTTGEELIYQADLAVYRSKLGGRNRVCLAPPPNRAVSEQETVPSRVDLPSDEDQQRPSALDAVAGEHEARMVTNATASGADLHARRRLGDTPPQLQVLMILVIALSALMVGTSLPAARFDLIGLAGLVLLTLAAEAWVVDLYGESSVSLMVIPILAGGMLFGVPGGAIIGLTAAISRGIMRRSQPHRVAFNAGVFVLGASISAIVFDALGGPLRPDALPVLLGHALIVALIYYVVNTSLISMAMGLWSNQNPALVWREQFRWLFVHYAVFGLLGLFLTVAYTSFGLYGLLAFAAPAFAMRYTMHQYISNTSEHVSELRRLNTEMQHSNDEMGRINEDLLSTLAAAIDVRDPFVFGHSTKVAEYAVSIAQEMHLGKELIELIRQAGLLHDIGKLGIAEAILHKPAKLDADEYETIKTHSVLGSELLSKMRRLQHLIPAIKHHHEWYNGRGYPSGLTGTEIPIEARVLAVCDAIEAMASDRPYHKAMPEDQIIAELQRCSGVQFDPTVVQAFVRVAKFSHGMVSNSAQAILQRDARLAAANGSAKRVLHLSGAGKTEILFGTAAALE